MQVNKKLPLIIKERLYVPEDYLDIERVEKLYTKALFNDQKCEPCEFMAERPNDMCEACDGYQGTYKLYVEKTKGNTTYYGLPLGNKKKILKLLPNIKELPKRDLRPNNKIKHKIEFTGTLRDYQRECVDTMKAKKSGVLEAPPRSGKCQVAGTLIQTADGLIPIENIVGNIPYDTPVEKVLPLNTKDGLAATSHIFKSKSTTIRITTEHGFSCEGTPEHPMLALTLNGLHWVHLNELSIHDSLVVHLHNDLWKSFTISEVEHTEIVKLASELKVSNRTIPEFVFTNRSAAILLINSLLENDGLTINLYSKEAEKQVQILLTNLNLISTII